MVSLHVRPVIVPATAGPEPGVAPGLVADFSGSQLNTRVWATCYPWMDTSAGCTNFGNTEYEWYLLGQDRVSGGVLQLQAQRVPTQGQTANGAPSSTRAAPGWSRPILASASSTDTSRSCVGVIESFHQVRQHLAPRLAGPAQLDGGPFAQVGVVGAQAPGQEGDGPAVLRCAAGPALLPSVATSPGRRADRPRRQRCPSPTAQRTPGPRALIGDWASSSLSAP